MNNSQSNTDPYDKYLPVNSLPDSAQRHTAEWLAELVIWVSNGSIIIDHDSDKYYSLIAKNFPIGINRIDWHLVNYVKSIDVIDTEPRTWEECRQALKTYEKKIQEWFNDVVISHNEEFLVMGDCTDIVLRMNESTFFTCYDKLLVSGQHVYVIPSLANWCLNYTMEDQLFFGLSNK